MWVHVAILTFQVDNALYQHAVNESLRASSSHLGAMCSSSGVVSIVDSAERLNFTIQLRNFTQYFRLGLLKRDRLKMLLK